MTRVFVLTAILYLPIWSLAATAEEVLRKMDQAALKFSGLSASLNKTTYTKVIDDKSEETGVIQLKKLKPRELQVLIDFAKPDPRTVAFRGTKAEIYYPKMRTVQEYNLGKNSDLIDQFLLLGFGTTGKDLQSGYTIKYAGEETIAGQKSHKLDLLPKTGVMKEKLSRLELWLSDDGTHPVQQKFIEPSGNYTVFTYSAVKLNPTLTEEELRLKLPKGVKREYPQK